MAYRLSSGRFEKDLKEVNALAKNLMQEINDAKNSSSDKAVLVELVPVIG